MSTSEQIRKKVSALATERAGYEKKLADARTTQAAKTAKATEYRTKATKASSASSRSSYERQAATEEKEANRAGNKVGELSTKISKCADREAALAKDLGAALDREHREQARKDRETERKREKERVAERQRQERALRTERARSKALVTASEERMSKEMNRRLPPPRPEKLRILYLTASPEGEDRIRVDVEIRRVKGAVDAATHRDLVEIQHMAAATPGDLLDGLLKFKPHVLHFSGHGNQEVLAFDSEDASESVDVAVGVFARALGAVDQKPRLVVLNACHSAAHLVQLVTQVPLAIGMDASVGDVAATVFATRFYRAIAEGASVESAIELAKVEMAMSGLTDADLPVLEADPEVDPRQAVLVIPPLA